MEIEESSSEQNPNSRRDNSWKNFRSLSKMQYDTKETSKQLQGSTQRAHKQNKKCKKKNLRTCSYGTQTFQCDRLKIESERDKQENYEWNGDSSVC